jgi:hypothetical protein
MEAEDLFALRRTMAGFSDSDDLDVMEADATSSFWKTALEGMMRRDSGGLGLTSPAASKSFDAGRRCEDGTNDGDE